MRRGLIAAFCLATATAPVCANSVADFYKGRTIQLVVGYGPGGGYDAYARLIAVHLGKYIPGDPKVIVQNRPGAGSLRAVNYLHETAPPDGTVVGTFSRDVALMGITGGDPNAQFDPRKFRVDISPIGAADVARLLHRFAASPADLRAELRKPQTPKKAQAAHAPR